MIRFPVPYEPNQSLPCFSARSRREVQTYDAVNSRLVEHWQTDAPQLQYRDRNTSQLEWAMDMNPTASRLYREDLRQNQPYVLPGPASPTTQKATKIEYEITVALKKLDEAKKAEVAWRQGNAGQASQALKDKVKEIEGYYEALLKQQKQITIDAMSDNPYFDKYDVASDSRNIVREMRSVVTEDVVDRGLRESQKLLTRELENRWLPAGYAEKVGIDQLSAYELMRPKANDMSRSYRW